MSKPLLETDEGRSWVQMEATGRALREWEEKRADAYQHLMSLCRQSSDPKVTGAYEKLKALEEVKKYLSGKL